MKENAVLQAEDGAVASSASCAVGSVPIGHPSSCHMSSRKHASYPPVVANFFASCPFRGSFSGDVTPQVARAIPGRRAAGFCYGRRTAPRPPPPLRVHRLLSGDRILLLHFLVRRRPYRRRGDPDEVFPRGGGD
jgi:hypothetical protein